MICEIMVLLGKGAEMVVGKIQRCESGIELFTQIFLQAHLL